MLQQKRPQKVRPVRPLPGFDQLSDEQFISHTQLAAVAGRGTSTLWRHANEDPDFPPHHMFSSRCRRYRVGDVRRWLESKAAEPA